MTRICPMPIPWNDVYKRLIAYSKTHECVPPRPPIPLVLAGWAYSNDVGKMCRWAMTVQWATENGCPELVDTVPDSDFLFVAIPTTYTVGPMGGPMYLSWDFEEKNRPSDEVLRHSMDVLGAEWQEVAGRELARVTRPLKFTGKKARRLLVEVKSGSSPPWGSWTRLSEVKSERRTFTRFRTAINTAISPHEVDHVEFIVAEDVEVTPHNAQRSPDSSSGTRY